MPTPFTGFTKWQAKHPYSQAVNLGTPYLVETTFSAAEAAAATGTAILANDVFELINVPANTFVHSVRLEVLTTEGAASTVDIGDGATADGYLDGADVNAATNANSYDNDGTLTEAFGLGKFYATADTIDLKCMTGRWTLFKVKLTALMFQL